MTWSALSKALLRLQREPPLLQSTKIPSCGTGRGNKALSDPTSVDLRTEREDLKKAAKGVFVLKTSRHKVEVQLAKEIDWRDPQDGISSAACTSLQQASSCELH